MLRQASRSLLLGSRLGQRRLSSSGGGSSVVEKELVVGGAVTRLTLADGRRRNAMSEAMLEALLDEVAAAGASEECRAVVLAAHGPVFSSGHNLKELTSATGPEAHKRIFHLCSQLMLMLGELEVPVIAEVGGLAAAAGCQLVASADIAVASTSASFSVPGARAGLFCSTPGIALGRAVPRKAALDMLLTGKTISAEEALASGLVSRVVAPDQLSAEVAKVCEDICALSRPVLALGKSFFNLQCTQDPKTAYQLGETVMVENLRFHDAQEGIKAFAEKRPPKWQHSNEPVH